MLATPHPNKETTHAIDRKRRADQEARDRPAVHHQVHKERGYPPILKEIAKEVGVGTEMGASRHIEALVKKGYIKKEKKIHRGIQPAEGVEDLLEGINQRRLFEDIQKGVTR